MTIIPLDRDFSLRYNEHRFNISLQRRNPAPPGKKSMPNLEIERKWLIRRPDETKLSAMAAETGGSISYIIQTYLAAEEGISRRVRARTVNGSTTYTCTAKRRLGPMTAEEDERIISSEEYAALLKDTDPACRPIEKTRICIPFEGRTLEIDLYPFWPDHAVLEIELPSPDASFTLPPELTVLAEVTGNRAYSNHSLARNPFPPEIAKKTPN